LSNNTIGLRAFAAAPATTAARNEIFRVVCEPDFLDQDDLLAHPEAVAAYGELKKRLAEVHTENSLAYTRAKTAFIQDLNDKARAQSGIGGTAIALFGRQRAHA